MVRLQFMSILLCPQKFLRPHTGPKSVIVTGTFDQWSSSRQLTKTATGFVGTTNIPWNKKILYKYIVDGNWTLLYGRPIEVESKTGFVNHVYIAPPKPQVVLPESKPEPLIADTTAAGATVEKNVDIPTTSYPTSGAGTEPAASPVTEEPANKPIAAPIAVEAASLVDDAPREPIHVDVGEPLIADANSVTTAVDPEPTADTLNAPLEPVPSPKTSPGKEREQAAEKKVINKPSALPSTPTKGEVFPSVSPPSSPSRFGSLRGSGKKKRTPSFFAKLKEVFKSDKEKDHHAKEKAETKN